MHSNPAFWLGNSGYVDFLKERFLEYTEDHLKNQFQLLDENAINKLKTLPTLFAVEHEYSDTRIGKITKIEVNSKYLRIYYEFSKEYYPLAKGVLQKNSQQLQINKSGYEFYRNHWAIKECDIQDFYKGYLKTLTGIAYQLKEINKKVQLIYAFNGSGKTRLSQEFKQLIAPKNVDYDGEEQTELTRNKILYYNAFTEDLFYWDNDLEMDAKPKLNIQPNSFTNWILNEQGDVNIIENFQRYTDKNLTPKFIPKEEVKKDKDGRNIKVITYPEVVFTVSNKFSSNLEELDIKVDDNNLVRRGEDENIKISKGEESNFVWSIFYTLLQEIASILKEPNPSKRSDSQFDQLEYVFIDDPVSSLDENHLIELAVDLARFIKSSSFTDSKGLRFIITTHNPLFYNVLCNEFNNDLYEEMPDGSRGKLVYKHNQSRKYRLNRKADGTFELKDSNDHPFSYHLFLLSELREAIKTKQIRKYHFSFLRNILEKTATFLGHNRWENLLEKINGHPDPFANRILNLSSHSAHSGEETADIKDKDKEDLEKLLKFLTTTYGFKKEEIENDRTN